jgi:hypothetical protein
MPRHLLYGNDYSNRPGSSYNMNNVVGQAIEDFNSAINTTNSSNTTASTGARIKIS